VADRPEHQHYVQDHEAAAISYMLKIMQPHELEEVSLNQEGRRRLTQAVEEYYSLHIPEFGSLRTLPVLREVLS
jgi:DNA repair protein RecO (recombination protein O)